MTDSDFPDKKAMLFAVQVKQEASLSTLHASNEHLTPYEANREKVAKTVEDFFSKVDSDIAQKIGFDGNILHTLFDNFISGEIRISSLPEVLKKHINGTRFDSSDSNKTFLIECRKAGFSPEVRFSNCGVTTEVKVPTGTNNTIAFDQVKISKKKYMGWNNFDGSREIKTFEPIAPYDPLVIDQRTKTGLAVSVRYSGITPDGGVNLRDGQIISLRDFNGNAQEICGEYSASKRSIEWKLNGENANRLAKIQVEFTDNTLKIAADRENIFTFPISTNIHTELQNALSGINQPES